MNSKDDLDGVRGIIFGVAICMFFWAGVFMLLTKV